MRTEPRKDYLPSPRPGSYQIEYMKGMDGRWRIYRAIPRCPTCGHDRQLMTTITREDFDTQEQAEMWYKNTKMLG